MSGFDAGWLDLREPADHRALARGPLDRLQALFGARRGIVSVADLGAGSGSLLRALAPRLGARQRWMLVERDPLLLRHARTRLCAWADAHADDDDHGVLWLTKGGLRIEVAFLGHDLARDPLPEPVAGVADLVTASAFFDLVGADWLEAFMVRLAKARRPLYAPLIYSGRKTFAPPHPGDAAVLAAFNRHQRGDKGLGPALGPDAPRALAKAAEAAGYACMERDSPWRLEPADGPLVERLVSGMADAVGELPEPPPILDDWSAFRLAAAKTEGSAEVAHVDLLLEPQAR